MWKPRYIERFSSECAYVFLPVLKCLLFLCENANFEKERRIKNLSILIYFLHFAVSKLSLFRLICNLARRLKKILLSCIIENYVDH